MQIDINPDALELPALIFIPERGLLVHIRTRLPGGQWEIVQDYTVRTMGARELQGLLLSARYWANKEKERRR